jgi:hypothetical protein
MHFSYRVTVPSINKYKNNKKDRESKLSEMLKQLYTNCWDEEDGGEGGLLLLYFGLSY